MLPYSLERDIVRMLDARVIKLGGLDLVLRQLFGSHEG